MAIPFLLDSYKILAFHSAQNKWNGLLQDKNVKKHIAIKIEWADHLLLYMNEELKPEIESYLNLKYSDIMIPVTTIIPDFTPAAHKDYKPVYSSRKMIWPNKGRQLCF